MNVKIKKLDERASVPTRGSSCAAGYDLYACLPDETSHITIWPHSTVKIGTGLSLEIPDGYFGAIFARSGLATKSGLRPSNCVGVIDSDYRGEVIVALHNDSEEMRQIVFGERIAQLVIMPYLQVSFTEVDELNETDRGDGGFGSTGETVLVAHVDLVDDAVLTSNAVLEWELPGQINLFDI